MPKLHKYAPLWEQYPDYYWYPDSAEVKKQIGGNVDASWIKNTCAVRLSRTLNYNGHPVPRNFAGLLTVKGGDGKRYALRVREVRKWLRFRLGKPDIDLKKKEGAAFDKKTLSAVKGIIAFDIRFSDATGHLDLWDGRVFSSEHNMSKNYWVNATRISVWTAPS